MLRRSFLMSLAALGLSSATVLARTVASRDFRTADLMTGGFASTSSQVALNQTGNPDLINYANAEIAEQVQVAAALGAAPGSAPL
jgi:putative membrane protein